MNKFNKILSIALLTVGFSAYGIVDFSNYVTAGKNLATKMRSDGITAIGTDFFSSVGINDLSSDNDDGLAKACEDLNDLTIANSFKSSVETINDVSLLQAIASICGLLYCALECQMIEVNNGKKAAIKELKDFKDNEHADLDTKHSALKTVYGDGSNHILKTHHDSEMLKLQDEINKLQSIQTKSSPSLFSSSSAQVIPVNKVKATSLNSELKNKYEELQIACGQGDNLDKKVAGLAFKMFKIQNNIE